MKPFDVRRFLCPEASVAAAVLTVVVAFGGRYGFFRDELYYLACARKMAFGYVDHPPLSIAILAAVGSESLLALKALAGLAGALGVFLLGRTARAMGGDGAAALTASGALASAPGLL